jgi:protein involved in sex pheromone biosynthesis
MKKILIISLLFTSFLVTSCGKKVDNTETPNNSENIISQNTNPNVVKKQEIEGLLFDNIILKTNNNMSYFTANVTNTTDEKINVKYIKITVYDNENKELFSFNNYIGDYIESKSTLKLSSNIEGDLTTIYSVKYEVIK